MYLELTIKYTDIGFDYRQIYGISIDYLDNTLKGILSDGDMMGAEIPLLNFSNYGILLDNRFGGGYDITYVDGGLLIRFKKSNR